MALQNSISIWETGFDNELNSLTYNGEIDQDIINVLKETAHPVDFFYTKIADRLSLNPRYVELILHYLSELDLVDYGTSPRGSWINENGKKYLELIKGNL